MSLYCYLDDTALQLKSTVILNPSDIDQGIGLLNDTAYNYFNTPRMLNDPRTSRLQVLTGGRANGNLMLYFDADKLGSVSFTGVTNTEYNKLFNVIETVLYTQDSSQAALDALLSGNPSAYGVYVAESLVVSEPVKQTTVNIVGENGNTTASAYLRKWVSFTATLHSNAVEFTIYFDTPAFMADYPYSTITKVIYPCDPSELLDTQFADKIAAIAGSAGWMDDALSSDISNKDHSGLYKITSRYMNNESSTWYEMPFSVLYKGIAPTAQQARDAIRVDLLSLNLTTEDTWKEILPDLFAANGFFLVPMWNKTTELEGNITLYQGIVNHKSIADKLVEIYPELDATAIRNTLAIFKAVSNEMVIAAIPYETNAEGYTALDVIHPTYQTVSSGSPLFNYQTATTQEFNINIADGMGVLLGGSNTNSSLISETVDGRNYLTFVTDHIEYRMLKVASFPLI